MARPSATALLLLLVLSLLAVATHCRTLEADAAASSELESNSAAVAVSDENGGGLSSSDPTLPAEAEGGASANEEEEQVLPAAEQQHGFGFLRLPSHRLRGHRPCSGSLHRHLHLGYQRPEAVMRHRLPFFPAAAEEEAREAAEEAKAAVAEPDPNRSLSLPDTDGEAEPSSFVVGDENNAAAVRAWKKEMLRRWVHFHLHHGHGGMRGGHHRLHHDDEQQEEEGTPEGVNMKRFVQFRHHHHHDGEDEEEKNMVGKRGLRRHAAEHDEDSVVDGEDEQVEEMVRRFRKAIMMRRRFGHGHGHGGRGFFHHNHYSHRGHAEQAGGEEESGVMAWIKGLMNRF